MFSSSLATLRAFAARAPLYLLASVLCLIAMPDAWAQTPGCQVAYTKAWEGGNGFGANIDITNTGPAITNGWTLQFDFPNGQRLQNGWPVAFSQPPNSPTMTISSNAAWNQSIGSGATFTEAHDVHPEWGDL
jgi:cellulose 1,4-beta-cellobiosidase